MTMHSLMCWAHKNAPKYVISEKSECQERWKRNCRNSNANAVAVSKWRVESENEQFFSLNLWFFTFSWRAYKFIQKRCKFRRKYKYFFLHFCELLKYKSAIIRNLGTIKSSQSDKLFPIVAFDFIFYWEIFKFKILKKFHPKNLITILIKLAKI